MADSVTDLRKVGRACTTSGWICVQAVLDVFATAPVPFAGLPAVATQYVLSGSQAKIINLK